MKCRAGPITHRPRGCAGALSRGGVAGPLAARRQVLEHIRREQAGGRRRAALLTGSLEPLVADLAARLGVGVVGTVPALAPAGRAYTGRVDGRVCIGEEKRDRMLAAAAAAGGGACGGVGGGEGGLAGVGNSMYDAPFLAAVDRAAVVRPGRRLHRLAAQQGWDLSLASVRAGGGSGAGSGGGGGPAAAAARSFELCVGTAWALIAAGGCVVSGRLRQRYSGA